MLWFGLSAQRHEISVPKWRGDQMIGPNWNEKRGFALMRPPFFALLALVGMVATSYATELGKAERLRKVGGWTVLRTKDPMNDRVSCVAIYKGNYSLQLGAKTFYISYAGRGGVSGYRIRFDDDPASKMRLPSDVERRIGAVGLAGADFLKVLASKRLRVSTITVLQRLVDDDIDLSDAPTAHAVLVGPDCGSPRSKKRP